MGLKNQPLAEQAYQALLKQIIAGKRKAGEKLSEEVICAEFDISRTPAREALVMLTRDGLVEKLPRRGCFVKRFDNDAVVELFECRSMIECLSLSLGFETFPREKLGVISALLSRGNSETERKMHSLQADEMLHDLIAGCCPNRHIREIARQLQKQTSPFRSYRTFTMADAASLNAERQELIIAISSGDKEKALRKLATHIRGGKVVVEQQT